ncbi:MAG: hypothetical protein KJ955_00805 [Nanoarchaeota archaeon]|nr:hypothetical protein [Nanoarchaeota archaeon]
MIGLVVIVLLLIVLLMVYINFSSMEKPTTTAATANIIGNNMLTSMLNANICSGVSMEAGIKACANNEKKCGEDSCEKLEKEAKSMLKAYFGARYAVKGFEFKINFTNSRIDSITDGAPKLACPGSAIIPANRDIGLPTVANIQVKSCA